MFAVEFEGLSSTKMSMHRLRDLVPGMVLQSSPFDVRKSTMSLFMAEVLYRLIGESEANDALFNFAWASVEALDAIEGGVANFHLWFLANISRYLGFAPGNDYIEGAWFDMREGVFTPIMPLHDNAMNPEQARLLHDMTECDIRDLDEIGLNRNQRVELLSALVDYYSIHLDSIRRVQSLNILREVF
jgi:DNA repair protein RecO (recombination protein O)